MKKLLITMLLVAAMSGCIPTNSQIQTAATVTEETMATAEEFRIKLDEILDEYVKLGSISEGTAAEVKELGEEFDRIKPQAMAIIESLRSANVTDPNDQLLTLIELMTEANAASGTLNPYAAPVGLGLSIFGWLLTWLKKNKEVKDVTTKYKAHTHAEEEFKLKNPEKATELYTTIGKHRTALNVV